MMVVMLQKTFASDRVSLAGFDLPAARLADPDGKAFLALYSPLVARVPNLDGKFADAGAAVAGQSADISYRGADNSSRAFGMAIRQIESAYNEFFADAVEQYRLSTANIVWTQDMSWLAYTRRCQTQSKSKPFRARMRKVNLSQSVTDLLLADSLPYVVS